MDDDVLDRILNSPGPFERMDYRPARSPFPPVTPQRVAYLADLAMGAPLTSYSAGGGVTFTAAKED